MNISDGYYGKAFIEQLHVEIDQMIHDKELPNPLYFNEKSDELLEKARLVHEPVMMYLYAENCRQTYVTDNDAVDLYIEAAAYGSAHAKLWIMYCRDKGIWGFEKIPYEEQYMYFSSDCGLSSVVLEELSFLEKGFYDLYDAAGWADIMEDSVSTAYEYKDIPYEERPFPVPDSCTLVKRFIIFVDYIHSLGLPYCTKSMVFSTKDIDYEAGERLLKEKGDWEKWCIEKKLIKKRYGS